MSKNSFYSELIESADVVIDADTYEIYKSPFNSLTVGSVIDFGQTLKLMQREDVDVAVVVPSNENVIDTNFE